MPRVTIKARFGMAKRARVRPTTPDETPHETAADRRAREQAKDREVIAILTRDGGGVADKAEMLAEYHRLLAAGWKP